MRAIPFVVLVLAGFLLLMWLANRSFFYPMRHPQGDWEVQAELGARDVGVNAPNFVRLHAWWVQPEKARGVTLFLHGNAGNVTHRAHALRALQSAGMAVLLPDYRGYGKSSGSPTEKGLYEDAEASYETLIATGWKPERIVVHGESLGTAVALHLAARKPCAGVVLEAPFPSARAVAGRVLPLLGPLLVWGLDSAAYIQKVRAPILFFHGDRDEVIPYDLGRALYERAPGVKRFETVAGAGHNNLVFIAGEAYVERLNRFYASLGL
jgi:fermentation-respiration switch protein FrsA (DUF1100 family)